MNDQKFWEKVILEDEIFPENGCMLWTGARTTKGYAQLWDGEKKKRVMAYRWIYEHLRGPIPEGCEMDHLCRVHNCVNPDHLEPVTRSVNASRGLLKNQNKGKTYCVHGHPFNDENTYIYVWKGRTVRACKTCILVRNKLYRKKTI